MDKSLKTIAIICGLLISPDYSSGWYKELLTAKKPATIDPQRPMISSVFRKFNPKIDSTIIDKFLEVARAYNLDQPKTIAICVQQICLESAGDQTKVSPTGARGLGQIVPTTAFDILRHVSKEEFQKMRSLGVSSIQWAWDGKYTIIEKDGVTKIFIDAKLRKKAIAWLNDPVNNLVLWGFLMRKYMDSMTIEKSLLAYRLGLGGAMDYAGHPSAHPYVKTILARAKKKGAQPTPLPKPTHTTTSSKR